MTDSVGAASIALTADSTKLKAGIEDAKKSIRGLGKEVGDSVAGGSARASRSIDNYVKKLQTAAATNGMSARETERYTLSLRGASKAQLEAADSALRMSEGYEKGVAIGNQLRTGFIALSAAAAAAGVAVAAGTIALIGQVGQYQDLAEKIGDTATNVSSLKTASDVAGVSMDTIASASIKLTAALSKTDDESKLVGSAIRGLGLDFDAFKKMSPIQQIEAVAKAMDGFADGSAKTAYAVALFGKNGAELLGFLKEYAEKGTEAAYISEAQGDAADAFADAQARLQSQLQQFLQVTAVNAIPILNDVTDLFKSIATEEDGTSTATEILKGALDGVVTVFQAISIVASDVVFVFKGVGREIGAIAAQLVALATLDFSGFRAISDAVTDDAVRARAELDKFQAKVMAIGKGTLQSSIAAGYDDADARKPPKKQLNTSGLNQDKEKKAKKDNSAAQEAKAQLTADIEEIRKAQEALSNTIANSEKIMEAERSANLISESQYYVKKREFIQENDRVQQAAAQKEIERLQAEKLSGKDKIDNDRKIADAQAKLNKLRENATASLTVLSIKEKDALGDIERAYADAEAAAKSYLDQVSRAAQAEIDGVGQGQKGRNRTSDINVIEEKFEAQRQALQRDNRNGKFAGREDDLKRELALLNSSQQAEIAIYKAKYQTLEEMQKDWTNGATEALINYADESKDIASQMQDAFTNAFEGLEDALTSFVTTGKLDFKSLANSIIADMARIVVKQSITGPLAGLLSGMLGGGGGYSATTQSGLDGLIAGLSGRAIGGPVSAGGLYRVNEKQPELLNVAGKQYLMMGNQGGSVTANGGGGQPVIVHQNFTVGDVATVSMVRDAVKGSEARISGALGRSQRYGGAAA